MHQSPHSGDGPRSKGHDCPNHHWHGDRQSVRSHPSAPSLLTQAYEAGIVLTHLHPGLLIKTLGPRQAKQLAQVPQQVSGGLKIPPPDLRKCAGPSRPGQANPLTPAGWGWGPLTLHCRFPKGQLRGLQALPLSPGFILAFIRPLISEAQKAWTSCSLGKTAEIFRPNQQPLRGSKCRRTPRPPSL